jgi:hypothetical protein
MTGLDSFRSARGFFRAQLLPFLALLVTGCTGNADKVGPGAFTQADLAGNWRVTVFRLGAPTQAGQAGGWIRSRLQIDAAGNVTVVESLDSVGNALVSTSPTRLAVDGAGMITLPVGGLTRYRGKLSAARDFYAATASQGDMPTLRLAQRIVPGTTYAPSDLTGTWHYHAFGGGSLLHWEHGTMTVAADGTFAMTSIVATEGPQPDDAGNLLLSSDGFMTVEGNADPSWSAFMSADKSLIVGTYTANAATHEEELVVITRAGASFTTGSLAGEWQVHMLNQNLTSSTSWAHSGVTFSTAGAVGFHDWEDSAGGTTAPSPAPTVSVVSDGTVTQLPAGSSYHGTLSADGHLMIATTDRDAGAEATMFVSVR